MGRDGKERIRGDKTKSSFFSMIMMNHPDFLKTFYLQTDASNVALGVELYQEDDDKEHRTIAFASRSLLAAERNYMTTAVSYTHLDVYKRQISDSA